MPNVSLQPLSEGPDTAELISRVEDGYYIVGDDSWSIDMQRYNFQFTGQRWYRIKGGRLAGMVKHGAYQATTTDFWRSMVGLGGPQTYLLAGVHGGRRQPGRSPSPATPRRASSANKNRCITRYGSRRRVRRDEAPSVPGSSAPSGKLH